jgi:hypothetical protein
MASFTRAGKCSQVVQILDMLSGVIGLKPELMFPLDVVKKYKAGQLTLQQLKALI